MCSKRYAAVAIFPVAELRVEAVRVVEGQEAGINYMLYNLRREESYVMKQCADQAGPFPICDLRLNCELTMQTIVR